MTTTVDTPKAGPEADSEKRRKTGMKRPKDEVALRNIVVGVIIVSIVLLVYVPIVIAFVGSFHNWNPLKGTFKPVGLSNYERLFSDATFWTAMKNTLFFGVGAVVGRVALGLALAYAIYSKMTRWKTFFRAIFYMPTVTPLIAIAYVWTLMYNPQFGAINRIAGLDVNWLFDQRFAMPAIILMTIWKDFGFAVILFLAGLYSLPEEVLEAAEVDGASGWNRFRLVILPLLKPSMVFVVITSMISYLQAFVQVMVMTKGGPGTSTQMIGYMIYDQAFLRHKFGYASALAFILLIFTALLTWASWKFQGERDPEKPGFIARLRGNKTSQKG